MLDQLDLESGVAKSEYKQAAAELEIQLGILQRQARELRIPVILVFEGWGGAGKGTQINTLIHNWDPRGYSVHSIQDPSEEESLRPFLWRFWTRTPAKGKIAVFDRSWYGPVLRGRVEGEIKGEALREAFGDIDSFERQLADAGTLIIKFFLHISRGEQKKRFKRLEKEAATAWRVTKEDREQNHRYDDFCEAAEDMLSRTDWGHSRWYAIPAHDERTAALEIARTVANAMEDRIRMAEQASQEVSLASPGPPVGRGLLAGFDLGGELSREEYKDRLDAGQEKLRLLEHEIYMARIPVVIVYEGWDAAGKGGNIRRLTREMDPRGYEVIPVAAPNDIERAHHYLWRFWTALPKAGHLTIFDRSWYGRVLVERVEGFCSREEWQRSYSEINAFERHLTNFGTVVIKFWLQIDREEQLRRFQARQNTPYKEWKITEDDWRNRDKWGAYEEAVEEMLQRTSTPQAPWTVVPSNCKRYARVMCIETAVNAIAKALPS